MRSRPIADAWAASGYQGIPDDNTAMNDQQLQAFPQDRVLPETDFPAKRTRATKHGEIEPLQQRLAVLRDTDPAEVRRRWWINLRNLATRSGALERFSE